MQTFVIHLEAHVMEAGMWCHRCLLPARFRIVLTRRADPSRWLGQLVACDACQTVEKIPC